MVITQHEFDFFREWAIRHAAISLQADKDYLIRSRLDPVARSFGLESLAALMETLSAPRPPQEIVDATIDAFTTNETLFFRDKNPFVLMREKLLPALVESRKASKRIRIWSAACSTGQEIYSIAMTIRESFPELLNWDLDLVATDVSNSVLDKARAGLYTSMEVGRGLDPAYKARYFSEEEGGKWRISNQIRSMVNFSRLNFIEAWPDLGTFDMILIRNALIYFEVAVKRDILNKVKSRLAPDGYMMLGTAETTINIDPTWKVSTVNRATYFTK